MTRRRNQGVVVAPQSEAAHAGALVLGVGGNAADAAVTAALVQGIVDPHRCGLGGFGCSTLFFPAKGGAHSIDFHGRTGRLCRPDQWTADYEGPAADGFGYLVKGKVNDVGYAAITTPGVVAGLAEIHQRFGSLPWKDLVLRAVPYAEEGFLVTPQLADFWLRPGLFGRVSTRDRLALTKEGQKITLKPDGATYKAGDIFKQPVLAETYRRLAEEGPDSFYRGSLFEQIAADFEANGALVTREDLAAYRPDVGAPLQRSYRGYEVLTTPLPGGGTALLQLLKLLESEELMSLGHNTADYVDRIAPACRTVWTDRLNHHGDPKFKGLTEEELLSEQYIDALRPQSRFLAGAESPSTTQVSIVDSDENCVSLSHSLGYGSGVFTEGLGFMYNNCMSAFDPRPGFRNSIDVGKARSTAVAETILLRDGKPFLVLGSPGAARITAGIAQVIVNVVDFGLNAAEACIQPRFDAYGERRIVLESRFPPPVVDELVRRGWDVKQSATSFGLVGRVYAVELDPTGKREPIAGVDPGEPGASWRGMPTRS